ncbi:hypothetical protein GUITHDRAFT_48556, partial [Guillardia theta CCMP2712]
LSNEELQGIKDMFRLFDTDNNDTMDEFELRVAMRGLGYGTSSEQAHRLFMALDKDHSGCIESSEAKHLILGSLGALDELSPRELGQRIKQAFVAFDSDGSGSITADELSSALLKLGLELSELEVQEITMQADTDGDGIIRYDEFEDMVK